MNAGFADGAVFCGVISGADKIKYMRLVMELLMKGGGKTITYRMGKYI